jgi:hypothetical protein
MPIHDEKKAPQRGYGMRWCGCQAASKTQKNFILLAKISKNTVKKEEFLLQSIFYFQPIFSEKKPFLFKNQSLTTQHPVPRASQHGFLSFFINLSAKVFDFFA